MRFHQVQDRAERHDARRIDLGVCHIVMALDVVEIDRLGDTRLLIEVHQITPQVRIVDDAPEIAFEMPVVDDVEADERAKHSPIGFNDAAGKEITRFRQTFIHLVERFEEFLDESVETRRRDGALRGIQFEEATDGSIALAVDDKQSGHLETEHIQAPQRIILEQTEEDVDAGLEIDGPQSCLILRFRSPMPPEMVDGML